MDLQTASDVLADEMVTGAVVRACTGVVSVW
jgi:hypothetical protein